MDSILNLPAILRFCGALLCTLLLVPAVAHAKPPKKPKNPKSPPTQQTPPPTSQGEPVRAEQTPPPGLDGVGQKLWHYQTDGARESLSPFLDKADSNAYVAMALGRVLEQQKSYDDAEARLRKATELAPNDPAPFVYLGEVFLRRGRDGDADNAFRKAAEAARAKGGAEAAYFLGIAQQRLKQYDEAVGTFQGAEAPQPALLPYQIGVTRALQQNWSAALPQLDRALSLDSGLAYAYYYRGMVQNKLGHKDRLVNDMERFLALAPSAPEADEARAVLQAVRP